MTICGANPNKGIKAILEPQPVPSTNLEWLVARRVGRMPTREGAGTLFTRLRDEGER